MTAAHPAAKLFPLMEGEDYQGLVESIRDHGLREPIVTLDGKILDGRNRERACADAGVKPRYVEAHLNGGGPVDYVLDKNLHRRNLTRSQMATVAANGMGMLAAEAKERQRESGRLHGRGPKVETKRSQPINTGRAADLAAEKFHVASPQIKRAIALKKRSPELFSKVESGDLTIGSALKKAGLNASGATTTSARPRDKHKPVLAAVGQLVRLSETWKREMTDALTPPQARKQLTVLNKAAALLAEVIEAVEYRAATPYQFMGR